MLALNAVELQVLGIPLIGGLLVAWGALHILALADRAAFVGAAGDQVDAVVARVSDLVARHPEAAAYTPGAIL